MQDKKKKTKEQSKVRDLKPEKDAKGGCRKAGGDPGSPTFIQGPGGNPPGVTRPGNPNT